MAIRIRKALLGSAGLILVVMAGLARLYIPAHPEPKPIMTPSGLVPSKADIQKFTPFQQKILADLQRQVHANILYRDTYFRGGEPPAGIGVCTDVILRSYRAAGVNLQKVVSSDIKAHMSRYHLTEADPNIDHRRCRNLVVFLTHCALVLPSGGTNADWQPGDIVFWSTGNRDYVDHCGVISAGRSSDGSYTAVHHWPGMPVTEIESVYRFRVRYHFRWKQAISRLAVNPPLHTSL